MAMATRVRIRNLSMDVSTVVKRKAEGSERDAVSWQIG
jgi:hypothetical protein